jgi:MoaA/NifB/PqqE/SkfB family radical SAM enzyme
MAHDSDANYVVQKGCPAGKESFYISPYGDVLGCPFIQISLGNVMEESLKTIHSRVIKNKYYGNYHPKCLIGEDHDFIERYSKLIEKNKGVQLPLSEKSFNELEKVKLV